jgi:RecA-family ATPase
MQNTVYSNQLQNATRFLPGARIFPISPNTKKPSFAGWQKAATSDPAQLVAWAVQNPGCAWAIACAESGLIGVEVDPKALKVAKDKASEQAGFERAEQAWRDLCKSWQLPEALVPHVRSRSGGMHFYFRPPAGISAKDLKQRGLVKLPGWQQPVIETRVNGFLLIPPSEFEGRAYTRWPGGPNDPYDAPPQLIEALLNTKAQSGDAPPAAVVKPGSFELRAFAKYVCKVHHRVGMPREVWRAAIFATVAQYGRYVAYQIAQAIHDGEPQTTHQIDDLVGRAREAFQPGDSTLDTLFKYAHENGIPDIVPKSVSGMFGFPTPPLDIDAILAEIDTEAAVASLPPLPPPPGAPLLPPPPGAPTLPPPPLPTVASPSIAPALGTDDKPKFPVFSAASLDGIEVPLRRWHVRDWIPAETVTLLYGDGGVGKSLIALQLLASTALGRSWLGHVVERGPCLFVTAEDSKDEIHRRLADIARENAIPLSGLTDLHIVSLAGEDAIIAAPDGRSTILVQTALFDLLEKQIERIRPKLVTLDTLADLFGGNEIDRSQARQFIGMLRGLALKYNTTILLLAHPSVAGMQKGTGSSGSTGWNNSVRSRLYFDRIRADDNSEPDPDARVLRSMKSNYGRVGEEIVLHWRRGVFARDSITAGGLMAAHDAMTRADDAFVRLLMLYEAEGRGAVSPNPGSNYAPKIFADHAQAQGFKPRALKGAMDRLLAMKRIETIMTGPPSRMRQHLVVSNRNYPLTNGPTNAPTNAIPTPSNGVPTPLPTPMFPVPTPYQRPAIPTPIPPTSLRAP